jgi:hypothetical protein
MFAPRTCTRCGKPLPLTEPAGGRPSHFCSGACRAAAYRARSAGFVTPRTAPKPARSRPTPDRHETPVRPSLAAQRALKMRWGTGAGRIEVLPDPVWPGMFRIHHRAGHVSDMVNLARARDAAQALAGVQP